jgi:hypothetical protein
MVDSHPSEWSDEEHHERGQRGRGRDRDEHGDHDLVNRAPVQRGFSAVPTVTEHVMM